MQDAKQTNTLQQPDHQPPYMKTPPRTLVLEKRSTSSVELGAQKRTTGPSVFYLDGMREKFPEMYTNMKAFEQQKRTSPLHFDDFDSEDEEEEVEPPQHHENVHQHYTKLTIENGLLMKEDPRFKEYIKASRSIKHLLDIREGYMFPQCDYKLIPGIIEMKPPSSEPLINYFKETRIPEKLEDIELKNINGVFVPYIDGNATCKFRSVKDYLSDMKGLLREACDPVVKTFCYKRLCLLSEKFKLHCLFNREKEFFEQKMNIHRDFYNIRKVDNQLDHTAAATSNNFVKFVVRKTIEETDTTVITDPDTDETLSLMQIFEKDDRRSRVITLANLEVHNYLEFSRRYRNMEMFSQSTFGKLIGDVFLGRDNLIKGRYLAELTHQIFDDYETYKFQYSEFRIQIFGKEKEEWNRMASWINTYEIYNQHVRWLIQIPRLYDKHRKNHIVKNFQEILDNVFEPLFAVTINPESNLDLHKFLFTVVGFDTLDDETGYHQTTNPAIFALTPSMWTSEENPHFSYWAYYLWANIYTLNSLRKSRGLNTFAFRPHVGELGTIERLVSVYLLAHGVSHGAQLNKSPLLQYLFYLKQIGVSMSPLSENKMYLKYKDNPFPKFFERGLNVSLSTDRPLLHHLTEKPLIEEYSIVGQVFDLNSADMCELARNSIIQSGFEDILKSYWIGEDYKSKTAEGNDNSKSNVPSARYLYRVETLDNEWNELKVIAETSFE